MDYQRPEMWEKQKEALLFTKKHTKFGNCLFMEMGTGKTRVAIHWLEWLFSKGARLAYVVAPLSVMKVWEEQWGLWARTPVPFIDLRATGSAGIRAARRVAKQWPVICLVNYENTWMIGNKYIKVVKDEEEIRELRQVDVMMHDIRWDAGILDESTRIKRPGTKISRYLRNKLAPKTQCKMVMSGTAYIKRPLDVWAQVKFATGERVFQGYFEPFKDHYSIPNPYIQGAVVGYKNLDELTEKLASCAVLLKKKDVLDLPPFVEEARYVELSAKSQRAYDHLTDDAFIQFEEMEHAGERVTATHIFSIIAKQRQITGGFIYPDKEEGQKKRPDAIRLGNEKLTEAISILEDRADPTLITVQYDEEQWIIQEGLHKKFGVKSRILDGSISGTTARQKVIDLAKDDPFFICKQSVAAYGIDLKYWDTTIFYSFSYDTEEFEQMKARNHRGGQTKSITYIYLISPDTIDEEILRAVRENRNLAERIEKKWRQILRPSRQG